MIKKINVIIFLSIITLGAISVGTTYAKFMLSDSAEGSIVVPEDNYCINNGFNKLSDCMLVMENYSDSVSSAKTYISSKGSVTTTAIAPTITFKEITTESTNANGVLSTTAHYTLGASYTFNTSTGIFTLTNYTNAELTDDYIDYYTCGATTGTYTTCSTMYQIKAYTTTTSGTTTTYKITSVIRHSYSAVDSFDSEIGLYEASDEDGLTYFYRGNVKNNYVSYAGFIWRIIRRNGDGTVRMIYSGTSTSATGSSAQIGTSAYNSKYYDPTYVGYKYGEDFVLNETNTTTVTYSNISDATTYYYASAYKFDEETKKFTLDGDITSGTWKDNYEEVISNYPYTCFSTSSTSSCNFIVRLLKYVSKSSATINYISYGSKDYESTLTNTNNSTIKTKVDTWYENNIKGKTDSSGNLYSDYLADKVFCNDRSLNTGSGYLMLPTTTYGAYNRLYSQKIPSLSCTQDSDKFSVANGNLDYPIALLTIDEASLAGGLFNNVNTQYYLYTGATYWTMSPSHFNASYAYAHVWSVTSTGYLYPWNNVTYGYGVRPVINLTSDVLLSGGSGTADNPYEVTLSNS